MTKNKHEAWDEELHLVALRWEREWRETMPRMSEREWLEEFPEMHSRIRDLIAEWEEVKEKNLLTVREIIQEIKAKSKEENRWFWEEVAKYLHPAVIELAQANRQLKRLNRLIQIPNAQYESWEKKIESAKNKNIVELAEEYGLKLRRSGATYVALCPFHRERTPSLTLYPRDNHFHCYGCSARGDVIQFVRLLEPHASFREVVDKLQ